MIKFTRTIKGGRATERTLNQQIEELQTALSTAETSISLVEADIAAISTDPATLAVHAVDGVQHSITASQYQVVGAIGANTLGLLTPSADVSAGLTAILRSNAGALGLQTLNFGATIALSRLADNKLGLADGDAFESNYTSGWAGSGFHFDYNQSYASQSFLELDRLSVRGVMNVYELLIHQIRATNGSIFVSNTGKAKTVTDNGGGSYTVETETAHGFAVDDLIRAQRFTGTGTYQSDMTVTAVADTTHFTADLRATYTAPAVGMEYVRLGNTSDADRQGSIYLTADDTNAPYINILAGVASFADWGTEDKTVGRIGNVNGAFGIASDYFGIGLGDYAGGNYLRYETNGGFVLSAGAGAITLDASGVAVAVTDDFYDLNSYRFTDMDGVLGGLYARHTSPGNYRQLILRNTQLAAHNAEVDITATAPVNYVSHVILNAYSGGGAFATLDLGADADGTPNSSIAMTATSLLLYGTCYIGASDTNLYRSAANLLKTDDSLTVAAGLNVGTATGAGTGVVSGRVAGGHLGWSIDADAGYAAELYFKKGGSNIWHLGRGSTDAFNIVESGVAVRMTIAAGGAVSFSNTIATAADYAWDLGTYSGPGTITPTGYITVVIDGSTYQIPAKAV